MIEWHVETDFFALAVFIAMLIKSHFISKEVGFENKVFSWVMVVCSFSTVVDIIASSVMNDPQSLWFYQIALFLIVGMIMIFVYHKKITLKYNIILIILFYSLTCASLFIQIANPGWLIIHATYAVIFMICDATIEEWRKQKLSTAVIDKNKELQDALGQLQYETQHDRLTGVYNRRTTFEKCRNVLKNHPNTKFDMIHVDIKRFRLFNAFYGDIHGDELLRDFSNILDRMVAEHGFGVCGRIEGDVFCLLIPYNQNFANRHRCEAIEFLRTYRDDFLLEPAIGIYSIEDRSMSVEAMFTRASIAARESKSHQLKYYCIFDEKLEDNLIAEQQIVNSMYDAIDKEQLQVYLQPKYNIKTDKPIGAEALVRWKHPTRGLISPDNFIPVFEKNGFIEDLDRYMWEHVCMLLRKWIDAGKEVYPVSVNVSRISMYSNKTVKFIISLIEKYKLPPNLLELELTESAYMDEPEEMMIQLGKLRKHGFKILMDDFGSGFSSLNTLRELPFDYLKLDMKFIENADTSDRAKIILKSVVDMAYKLNLPVISEGIETEEEKDFLKSIGCEFVQGYLYAKPMPVNEYEKKIQFSN